MLGPAGRIVRCTSCRHMWSQNPPEEEADILESISEEGVSMPHPELQDADDPSPEENPQPVGTLEDSFEQILQQTAVAVPPAPKIPDAVRPGPADFALPAPVTYKLMGMGPAQFGFLTFLMCVFISSSLLFLAKGPVVHAWPVLSGLYRTMGFEVLAPGEGLRLSDVTAENRIDKSGHLLAIEAKLTNISDKKISRPVLRATLKSAYGAVLQEWMMDSKDVRMLASGETVPVKSAFNDAPEGGEIVSLKVMQQ